MHALLFIGHLHGLVELICLPATNVYILAICADGCGTDAHKVLCNQLWFTSLLTYQTVAHVGLSPWCNMCSHNPYSTWILNSIMFIFSVALLIINIFKFCRCSALAVLKYARFIKSVSLCVLLKLSKRLSNLMIIVILFVKKLLFRYNADLRLIKIFLKSKIYLQF